MLTEVMSLGSLSRLVRGLKSDDKRAVAVRFQLHPKRLENWMHVLTYVRNVCAHHSRLWNRELAIRPDLKGDRAWLPPVTPRNDRVFYVLLMLRHLLRCCGNGDDWAKASEALLLPVTSNPRWRNAMGFPEDWTNHPRWVSEVE
jgi:abortive infection bacteriophage resistance protein